MNDMHAWQPTQCAGGPHPQHLGTILTKHADGNHYCNHCHMNKEHPMNPHDLIGKRVRIGSGKKTWIVESVVDNVAGGYFHLRVDGESPYAASTTIPLTDAHRLQVVIP